MSQLPLPTFACLSRPITQLVVASTTAIGVGLSSWFLLDPELTAAQKTIIMPVNIGPSLVACIVSICNFYMPRSSMENYANMIAQMFAFAGAVVVLSDQNVIFKGLGPNLNASNGTVCQPTRNPSSSVCILLDAQAVATFLMAFLAVLQLNYSPREAAQTELTTPLTSGEDPDSSTPPVDALPDKDESSHVLPPTSTAFSAARTSPQSDSANEL